MFSIGHAIHKQLYKRAFQIHSKVQNSSTFFSVATRCGEDGRVHKLGAIYTCHESTSIPLLVCLETQNWPSCALLQVRVDLASHPPMANSGFTQESARANKVVFLRKKHTICCPHMTTGDCYPSGTLVVKFGWFFAT